MGTLGSALVSNDQLRRRLNTVLTARHNGRQMAPSFHTGLKRLYGHAAATDTVHRPRKRMSSIVHREPAETAIVGPARSQIVAPDTTSRWPRRQHRAPNDCGRNIHDRRGMLCAVASSRTAVSHWVSGLAGPVSRKHAIAPQLEWRPSPGESQSVYRSRDSRRSRPRADNTRSAPSLGGSGLISRHAVRRREARVLRRAPNRNA